MMETQIESGNNRLFVIVIVAIIITFGLFGLWQYGLYQKLSEMDMSCGGDWSYAVKCPFGSYCRFLGQGSLAGGVCKPWFSVVFEVFEARRKEKQTLALTPAPSPKPTRLVGEQTKNKGVYTNPGYGFKIEYPPGWWAIENVDVGSALRYRYELTPLRSFPFGRRGV